MRCPKCGQQIGTADRCPRPQCQVWSPVARAMLPAPPLMPEPPQPYVCPKCDGEGTDDGSIRMFNVTAGNCTPCHGSGVVWGPAVRGTPQVPTCNVCGYLVDGDGCSNPECELHGEAVVVTLP